jgi:hypothetical protein
MPRIRTIKPEFWLNEELAQVSTEACLLAIGLLNLADDEGYFNANEKLIQAAIFPLRELSGSTPVMLRELSSIGYFDLFSGSDLRVYGQIRNFAKHQVINKKTPSKIKGLCGLPYCYGSATVGLPPGKERKGKERKGTDVGENFEISEETEKTVLATQSPTPAATRLSDDWWLPVEWELWCKKERLDLDPIKTANAFKDYWIAVPGVKGKKLDWFATWRNWVRNQKTATTTGNHGESFYQADQREKRKQWEEMTGRQWPTDNHQVIDMGTVDSDFLRIEQ